MGSDEGPAPFYKKVHSTTACLRPCVTVLIHNMECVCGEFAGNTPFLLCAGRGRPHYGGTGNHDCKPYRSGEGPHAGTVWRWSEEVSQCTCGIRYHCQVQLPVASSIKSCSLKAEDGVAITARPVKLSDSGRSKSNWLLAGKRASSAFGRASRPTLGGMQLSMLQSWPAMTRCAIICLARGTCLEPKQIWRTVLTDNDWCCRSSRLSWPRHSLRTLCPAIWPPAWAQASLQCA